MCMHITASNTRRSVQQLKFVSCMYQVVLGLEYSFPMDLWAIGCCLFELFTGKIAFPGKSNNEMLKLFMDLMGPFPKKMLKKAQFTERHFDNNYNFSLMEEDPVSFSAYQSRVSKFDQTTLFIC